MTAGLYLEGGGFKYTEESNVLVAYPESQQSVPELRLIPSHGDSP